MGVRRGDFFLSLSCAATFQSLPLILVAGLFPKPSYPHPVEHSLRDLSLGLHTPNPPFLTDFSVSIQVKLHVLLWVRGESRCKLWLEGQGQGRALRRGLLPVLGRGGVGEGGRQRKQGLG